MICNQCQANPLTPQHIEATQAGLCRRCWEKPFVITSVCRCDLDEYLTTEQIGRFDDADMQRLADKMAEAYTDAVFWIDLKVIAEGLLEEK